MSSHIFINLIYIVSAALFIYGLKMLTSPETARQGNKLSAIGMLIAVVITLFDQGIISYTWIIMGLLIGGGLVVVVADLHQKNN